MGVRASSWGRRGRELIKRQLGSPRPGSGCRRGLAAGIPGNCIPLSELLGFLFKTGAEDEALWMEESLLGPEESST